MSRIEQMSKIQREIEKGAPAPTVGASFSNALLYCKCGKKLEPFIKYNPYTVKAFGKVSCCGMESTGFPVDSWSGDKDATMQDAVFRWALGDKKAI